MKTNSFIRSPIKAGLIIALLAVAVLTVYWPSLRGTFLCDDYDWVTTAEQNIADHKIFAPLYHASGGNFYRPIQMLSFTFDVAVAGRHPVWFHVHQLLLFILLAAAVNWLIYLLFNHRHLALVTGLIFAVYPAHHEVVTWLAGRADIYAALFMCLAAAAAIKFVRQQNKWWLAISAITGLLALMSKESALVLPGVVILILAILKINDRSVPWRRLLIATLPAILALGAIFAVRAAILTDAIGGYRLGGEASGLNIHPRMLLSPLTSVGMLVNVDWLRHQLGSWPIVHWYLNHYMRVRFLIPTVAAIVGIGLALWVNWRRWWPILGFGIAWCLITFIPVIGLSNAIGGNLEGSRLFFTPSIGYALLFASGCLLLGKIFPSRWLGRIIAGLFIIFFAGLAFFNGQPWTKASAEVVAINAQLAANKNALIPPNTTDVLVSGLPAKTYGAYQYMGKHAIRGIIKGLAGQSVDVYLAGNARYTDSPFCTDAARQVVVLNWSDSAQQWSRDTYHEELLSRPASTSAISWTDKNWLTINMDQPTTDAIYRLRDGKSGLLLSGLTDISGSVYRSLNVHLKTFDTENVFGSRRATLAWSSDQTFTSLNQVSFTIPAAANSYTIPLCQYMNWLTADHINNLRLRPVQAGSFSPIDITLSPTP